MVDASSPAKKAGVRDHRAFVTKMCQKRLLGRTSLRIPTLIVHSSAAFYGCGRRSSGEALSAALEVRRVRKEYGSVVAVDDLAFEVDAGEILGVHGRNGAGKTTAIRVLTAILTPTRGEFAVAGIAHTDPGERLRRPRGLVLAPHPLSRSDPGRRD
jgi:ABC-type glutathione transport system ATPase component